MTNKFVWLVTGIIIGILLATYSVYNGSSDTKSQQTIDSLNKVINSKQKIADGQSTIIVELAKKDSVLSKQVTTLTQERNKARAEAKRKADNPNLSNSDTLYKFFVDRYPTEDKTVLSLPKESVLDAASELIFCDNLIQDVIYTDSINTILEQQITIKDSTIYLYQIKDTAQQNIISLQDVKYNTLNKEYTKVNTQNKLLKLSTKAVTAVAAILTVILVVR